MQGLASDKIMNDLRLGLPSASNAHSDSLCAGRHLCHSAFPSEDSEWSKHGTLVHLGMAGGSSGCSLEQLNWIRRASEIEDRVICNWAATSGEDMKEHREERLWAYGPLDDDLRTSKSNSGQADVFWIEDKRALLADYKSLFGDVPDAAENLQLRDLAVLIHLNYGVTEVTAYINQPRVTRNPKLVVYGLEDLKRAEVEMRERVKASMDPNSKRVPGVDQCKYCNGKLVCEEFRASSMSPMLGTFHAVSDLKPKELNPILERRLAPLPPDVLVGLRNTLKLTEMLQTAVNAEIRKRLTADGTSVPGLTLADGNKVRVITQILKAWELIVARTDKVTLEAFAECLSISIGDLEKAVKTALDCTADEATAWINETLGPIIELKSNAASIERVKE